MRVTGVRAGIVATAVMAVAIVVWIVVRAAGSCGRGCDSCSTPVDPSFAWIHQNIFVKNCFGASCHDAGGRSKLALARGVSPEQAYTNLVGSAGVGVPSRLDPTRVLVVPGNGSASYLEVMVQVIPPERASPPARPPPAKVGYMPRGNGVLCCEKLDAIDRWIMMGAPDH